MKIRLNSKKSENSVNEDSNIKINVESNSKDIPIDNIQKVINSGEQFNLERRNSTYYRLTGSLNTLFNNVLFNTSGNNSWKSFNEPKFRDATFPPNADEVSDLDEDEDLSYSESIEKYLEENNGWFGFYNPDPSKAVLCNWVDMEPSRRLFSMTPKNEIKNWEFTITYPTKVGNEIGDLSHNMIKGGLILISINPSIIGDRNMFTFSTPIKHGLKQGDTTQLSGIKTQTNLLISGDFVVARVGEDNGDNKEYFFSVDIGEVITLTPNARMSRIVGGKKSIYYLRKFTKINVKGGGVVGKGDLSPLAFSQTIYEDKVPQFIFNEDIDVGGLKDNLGRPLSELFLTIIKTDSSDNFTLVKEGIKMPYNKSIDNNKGIPDVNRITNDTSSNIPLSTGVSIDNDLFYGDIAEYNSYELKEVILGDVYHTFNSKKREEPSMIKNHNFKSNVIKLGKRFEGYIYKSHHKIQIREFSKYIEEGTMGTLNKPRYATNLGDGRYIWRDLLDIENNDKGLDYPFLNGSHYINSFFTLALKRQDPFNFYKLQHTTFPADVSGKLLEDDKIIKRSEDVC